MIEAKKKVFELVPAEDSRTQTILRARFQVLTHETLSDGAKTLYCLLLDFSLWQRMNKGEGRVVIATSALSEQLHRSKRAIWGWKKELVAARFIWLAPWFMPNTWAMHAFHITALIPEKQEVRQPDENGSWGAGEWRKDKPSPPPNGKKQHLVSHVEPEKTADSGEIQQGGDAEQHLPTASSAVGNGKKQHLSTASSAVGDGKKQHLSTASSAVGNGSKQHLPTAANSTCERQETAPLVVAQSVEKQEQGDHLSVQRVDRFKKGRGKDGKPTSLDLFKEEIVRICDRWEAGAGKLELVNWGGMWTNRFKAFPDKGRKIWAETLVAIKEGRIQTTPGRYAMDLWERLP